MNFRTSRNHLVKLPNYMHNPRQGLGIRITIEILINDVHRFYFQCAIYKLLLSCYQLLPGIIV